MASISDFSVNKSKYFSNCSLSTSTWDQKKNQAGLGCFIDNNTDDKSYLADSAIDYKNGLLQNVLLISKKQLEEFPSSS